MKKDYIPVSAADALLSETAFGEAQWTRIWDSYDLPDSAASGIEKREEVQNIEPYLATLPRDARILDGGCGIGEWTLYYATRGFDVVGLDFSRVTIAKLKGRFPAHNFLLGDIRNTEFENDHFDAYFSWGTFEHFEDGFSAPLMEANRIIRPGGYLFVSVPFQNRRHLRRDQRALWRWDENYDRNSGYETNSRFYQWRLTKPELQRELELNGFKTLRVEPIHKWQGLRRMVNHDLHIRSGSGLHEAARLLLYPVVPKSYVAHMIIGIGQKVRSVSD